MTSQMEAARVMTRGALFACTISLGFWALSPAAFAQQAAPDALPDTLQETPLSQTGISIRANVDVVFQPAFREDTKLMQSSFAAGAMGPNATTEYIFSLLNHAALEGLNQALAQGAKTGRVTVVATGCELGVSGTGTTAAQQVGIFINTTDMEVGNDGQVHFRTRVKFIPNEAVAPGAVTDPNALPDPDRIAPKF